MNRQAQPVTITVPFSILRAADRLAKKEGRTRSELFREALRAYFWKKRWEEIQAYGAGKAAEHGIKSEADIERIIDEGRS